MIGAGSEIPYDGTHLITQHKDVIFVTFNYRLGSLGFLNNVQFYGEDPDYKSYGGMNGIYDQIVALKWTKQFISDFGGDPDQITIFGESAGGLSVCTLLVSPLAKGLFHRAIVESGPCNGPWSVLCPWTQMALCFECGTFNEKGVRSMSPMESPQEMRRWRPMDGRRTMPLFCGRSMRRSLRFE